MEIRVKLFRRITVPIRMACLTLVAPLILLSQVGIPNDAVVINFTVSCPSLTVSQADLNANGINVSHSITYPADTFSFAATVRLNEVNGGSGLQVPAMGASLDGFPITPVDLFLSFGPAPHSVVIESANSVPNIPAGAVSGFLLRFPFQGTVADLTAISSGTYSTLTFQRLISDGSTGRGGDWGMSTGSVTVAVTTSTLTITTPTPLPFGVTGTPYSQTLTARGGRLAYTWSLMSGTLPSGLTLSSSGVISGTPAVSGVFTITVGVSDSASTTAQQAFTLTLNPPPVTQATTNISPNSATAGGLGFTLTVYGSGFLNGSTVLWNGAPLSTSYVNGNQLSASVPANLIASQGSATVTVQNPGGLTSNALAFTINAPAPSLTTLSPNSATAGGSPFTLTSNGSGFLSGSTVLWNGAPLSTSYVNGNQLSASVPANLIASQGSATITVQNPGGLTSNTLTFTINAPTGGPLSIITASPLPVGAVGVPYSQALAATGGVTPYKGWAISAGSQLPPGISLSNIGSFLTGLLNGVPSTPGTFSFTAQVTDGANTVVTKQFTLTITGGSISISANGVVNAASYAGGPVSPGEFVSIFGIGLGPAAPVGLTLDNKGYVSTNLFGTQVTFDGVAAPLILTSAKQVNVVVPYSVSGKTSTQLQVTYQGQNSNVVPTPVAEVAPGLFTIDASGRGAGAILNQDGTVNSAANPAVAGSYVFVYATGEGQTTPRGVDGKPGDAPAPTPITQPVTATVGGINAQVQYAGGVPGLVAGVLQVNVQIPQGVAGGDSVPIVLNIGGKPSQATVTLAVTAAPSQTLAVTSLSSSSLTPLTPLYIGTKGLDTTAPVTITFSNASGFSLTQHPIRVGSDGTIVAATPLYLEPATLKIGPGTVSMVITQGGQSTAPMSIAIQDLPPVSSYGMQPGQISRGLLVYEAMLITRRINEFQAYQLLPGNKVDTSKVQASLRTLLNGILQTRIDVDYVSLNQSLVISGETLSNGFRIQFDQNSLDLMDRVLALHLSQIASVVSAARTIPALAPVPATRSLVRPSWGESVPASLVGAAPAVSLTSANLATVLNVIDGATNQIGVQQAISDYYHNDATARDQSLAVAGGLGSLYGQMTLGAEGPPALYGNVYGAVVSSSALLNNLGMEIGDLGFLMYASRYGGDQSVVNAAIRDISERADNSWFALANAELNFLSIGSELGSFGPGVVAALKTDAGKGILKSAALGLAVAQCASTSCYADLETASVQAGAETSAIFGSDTQGYAIVDGNLQTSISFGPVPHQNEVQVSSNGVVFNSLADENGNYQMFVSLRADPFQYASADLQIVDATSQDSLNIIDPTSGKAGASQVIDLSALTTKAPLQLRAIHVQVDCGKGWGTCLAQCDAVWPGITPEWGACYGACASAGHACYGF